MFFTNPFKSRLPTKAEALDGRAQPVLQAQPHAVHGRPLLPPFLMVRSPFIWGWAVSGEQNGCSGSWMGSGQPR